MRTEDNQLQYGHVEFSYAEMSVKTGSPVEYKILCPFIPVAYSRPQKETVNTLVMVQGVVSTTILSTPSTSSVCKSLQWVLNGYT